MCKATGRPRPDLVSVSVAMLNDYQTGEREKALRKRERDLLEQNGVAWSTAAFGKIFDSGEGSICIDGYVPHPIEYEPSNGPSESTPRWSWGRGFIEEVSVTLTDWLAHDKAIVGACPVTKVVVTDREPYENAASCWLWHSGIEPLFSPVNSRLPKDVYCLLTDDIDIFNRSLWRTYRSRESAQSAISAALINAARHQHGWGPLR